MQIGQYRHHLHRLQEVELVSQSNESYRLKYGVDEQRRKSVYTKAGKTTTRYYIGDYEEEIDHDGNLRKIHYLSGAVLIQFK